VSAGAITTDGLIELIAAFKALETDQKLSTVLNPAQADVAKLVERESRKRATTRQLMKAEKSNRYRAMAASVSILIGGKGGGVREWAVGAQFGARTYPQFPAVKKGGYTVFPAIKENKDNIADLYGQVLAQFIAQNTKP
jgi:hypothetical protein